MNMLVRTHFLMCTYFEELRIPESGEANITPLGNKDRPRVQEEGDEATVKTCRGATTQSHLYLLSLVSRAMARGSAFPVEADPLRGENVGLENEMLWGKMFHYWELFLFVPKISLNVTIQPACVF